MKLDNRTEKRKLGDIGENVTVEYLRRKGFEILDRNYLRKWGEIDIVARNGDNLRFIEVKSVSHEKVPHVTLCNRPIGETDTYRPEENVHPAKLKRLFRTIQTYLLEKNIEAEWQLDVAIVYINLHTRQAMVEMIENIVA